MITQLPPALGDLSRAGIPPRCGHCGCGVFWRQRARESRHYLLLLVCAVRMPARRVTRPLQVRSPSALCPLCQLTARDPWDPLANVACARLESPATFWKPPPRAKVRLPPHSESTLNRDSLIPLPTSTKSPLKVPDFSKRDKHQGYIDVGV